MYVVRRNFKIFASIKINWKDDISTRFKTCTMIKYNITSSARDLKTFSLFHSLKYINCREQFSTIF